MNNLGLVVLHLARGRAGQDLHTYLGLGRALEGIVEVLGNILVDVGSCQLALLLDPRRGQ